MTALGSPIAGEAYNGRTIPAREGSVRQVRITTTANGRRMESLDGSPSDAGPRVQAAEAPRWSKVARAAQQVIFPIAERKPMP
jgi:hypothetical protein